MNLLKILSPWSKSVRRIRSGGTSNEQHRQNERRRFRPELNALEDRRVLSPVLVTDTTAFPNRAVVRITTVFPNTPVGEVWIGTGTMIDRFHVLTAGHVVYNYQQGGWAKSITITAGLNGSSEPYGVAYGTTMHTYNSFIQDSTANSESHAAGDGDVALVTLDRDLGDQTGWLGYGYNGNNSFFQNLTVSKIGYPADNTKGYNGSRQYMDAGPLIGVSTGSVSGFSTFTWNYSSMSSIGGESGSGIYYKDANGNNTIYGVLDLGNDSQQIGFGEEINQQIYNDIHTWIGQDTDPNTGGGSSSTPSPTPISTGGSLSPDIKLPTFVLLTGGNLYEHNNQTGVWTYLATGVSAISNSGTDPYGHPMVDVIRFDVDYEYSDTMGWRVLATGAISAKPGIGVSEVVLGANLYEWNDYFGVWRYLASGVSKISVGTDTSGSTLVGVLMANGNAYEFSDRTNWRYLASGASQISVGHQGYVSLLLNGNNLYQHSDATDTWRGLASGVASVWQGWDSNDDSMIAVALTNGDDYIYSNVTGWNGPIAHNASMSKPNEGIVYFIISGNCYLFNMATLQWQFLATNALEAV